MVPKLHAFLRANSSLLVVSSLVVVLSSGCRSRSFNAESSQGATSQGGTIRPSGTLMPLSGAESKASIPDALPKAGFFLFRYDQGARDNQPSRWALWPGSPPDGQPSRLLVWRMLPETKALQEFARRHLKEEVLKASMMVDIDAWPPERMSSLRTLAVVLPSSPLPLEDLSLPNLQEASTSADFLSPKLAGAWGWVVAYSEFLAPGKAFFEKSASGMPSHELSALALVRTARVQALARAGRVDAAAWNAFTREKAATLSRMGCADPTTCALAFGRYFQESQSKVAYPYVWKKASAQDAAEVGIALGVLRAGVPLPQADVELWDDFVQSIQGNEKALANARGVMEWSRALHASVRLAFRTSALP